MTTPTVPNVNVENLNSQIDNPTGAASDLGNDLLDRARRGSKPTNRPSRIDGPSVTV